MPAQGLDETRWALRLSSRREVPPSRALASRQFRERPPRLLEGFTRSCLLKSQPHPGCSIGKNAVNPNGSALEGDDQENTGAQGRVLTEAVVEPQPETTYCADI